MAQTRTVTGRIDKQSGEPWQGYGLRFTLEHPVHTHAATIPAGAIEIETDAHGAFSLELVTGIPYRLELDTGASRVVFANRMVITVPHGSKPIRLSEVIAASKGA